MTHAFPIPVAGALPTSLQTNPRLDQWIRFGDDGGLHVYVGKVELGQGIAAALLRVASNQLGVAESALTMLAGDTAACPDEWYTAGSQSIEVGAATLIIVCRKLRAMAAERAAQRLGVPVDAIRMQGGRFVDGAAPARGAVAYAELLGNADLATVRFTGPESDVGALPAPALDGAPNRDEPLRSDLAAKFTGGAYIQDLVLPGMWHARVLRGRHADVRPARIDRDALAALPGVDKLVVSGRFVALLGRDEGALVRAYERAVASMTWQMPASVAAETDIGTLLASLPRQTATAASGGTPAKAAHTLRATYTKPYIAHASIGPACALAAPRDGGLEVWSHTQGPHKLRDQLARALGYAATAVRVVHVPGAGCYGHNGADDVAYDAAFLARETGEPVRVQWMREDELTVSPVGSASRVDIEAGLDDAGRIAHWRAEIYSHTHLARPGWGEGINLLGAWEVDPPATPSAPADPPLPAGGGLRNALPLYTLPAHEIVHHFLPASPVRVSALRALGAYANVFAIESMMDELAEVAQADPVAFRLAHLEAPRARAVLEAAARLSGWQARGPGGDGEGWGVGLARYKNRSAWCAVVLRVRVEEKIRVLQAWSAVDAGEIIHRDGLLNQVEGGIVQALSWSLKEAVHWHPEEGITSATWEDYPILAFDEIPDMQIELIDQPGEPGLGSGEVAAGPTAAALANAVHHALGIRARDLPLTPEALARAINAA